MSNSAGITKDMYPEGTLTASSEGFHEIGGALAVPCVLNQAEVDEWNGTSSDLPETGDTTTSSASPEAPKVKPKAKKPAKKKKWFKK